MGFESKGHAMPDIQMRFGRDMLVVEGGMGVMLERYGAAELDCPEMYNVSEPELIEEIHKYYNMAGAQCCISNTYGASRSRLAALGLEDCLEDFNVRGVRIAKSHKPQHVLADMGQSAILARDDESYDEAFDDYAEQARLLASEEPDAIYLETMQSIDDAVCAVDGIKDACDLPVICSCVYDEDGNILRGGETLEDCARQLQDAGADVIGMNCNLSPDQMLALAPRLVEASDVPVIMCPDVPAPKRTTRGDLDYGGATDNMARVAVEMKGCGVQMIGTCCGSTPAYTSAIYAMVGDTPVAFPVDD